MNREAVEPRGSIAAGQRRSSAQPHAAPEQPPAKRPRTVIDADGGVRPPAPAPVPVPAPTIVRPPSTLLKAVEEHDGGSVDDEEYDDDEDDYESVGAAAEPIVIVEHQDDEDTPMAVAEKPAKPASAPKVKSWRKFLDLFSASSKNGDLTVEYEMLEAMGRSPNPPAQDAQLLLETTIAMLMHAQLKIANDAKSRLQMVREMFGTATARPVLMGVYAYLTHKMVKYTVARQRFSLSLIVDVPDPTAVVRSKMHQFHSVNHVLEMFDPATGGLVADIDSRLHSVSALLDMLRERTDTHHRRAVERYMKQSATSLTKHSAIEPESHSATISILDPWLLPGLMNVASRLALRRFSSASNYSMLAYYLDQDGYLDLVDQKLQLPHEFDQLLPECTFHMAAYEPLVSLYLNKVVAGTSRSLKRAELNDQSQVEPLKTLRFIRDQLREEHSATSELVLQDDRRYEVMFTRRLNIVTRSKDGYLVEELNRCILDVHSTPYPTDKPIDQMAWSERVNLAEKHEVTVTLHTKTGAEIKAQRAMFNKPMYCIASHKTTNGYQRATYLLKPTAKN